MIKEMSKIQIIGPKSYLEECIKVLHAAAVVHIETADHPGKEEFLKRLPLESQRARQKEDLERSENRLKNLLALLKPPKAYRQPRIGGDEVNVLLERVTPVDEKVKSLSALKDELNEELSIVNRYEKLLRGFAPIVSRLGGLKNFEVVGLTLERTREDIPGLISAEIGRITEGRFEFYKKELDETTTGIVITYPRRYDEEIKSLLSGKAISEIRLPDEYAGLTLLEALRLMGRKKVEIPARTYEADRGLEKISSEWFGTIRGLLRTVEDLIDEIGAITYAAQTRFAFVIEGWVPVESLEDLKKRLAGLFGDKILLRELEITKEEREHIPVYIKNPAFIRPFEVFLSALSPPRYGSIDPTPLLALFFPAFFGLIVGDVGYGALILAVSLYLRKRFKKNQALSDISAVMSVSSVSAIIFGFLFGEAFGDLAERLGILHPIVFNRVEALKPLIVVAFGIGIGHVLLGFVLGVINNIGMKKPREALAKAAYFIFVISVLVALGAFGGYIQRDYLPYALGTALLSLAALTALEGILGPLESISALGNIVSYVRLMAVGTASVVMAIVANKIGSAPKSLFIGIVAGGLLHILNLLLSVLSPSIQSMRLQYVEFFSKFYEGGGRKYTPFKKR